MPLFFFNVFKPFMPEKKKLNKNAADGDDLGVVKAAAWAWYERGARSEGKPMPSCEITRTQKAVGLSRYKLEALAMAEKAKKVEEEEKHKRCRFDSLLDSYEIESISKQFLSLLEPGRWSLNAEFVLVESFQRSSTSPATENGDRTRTHKNKKKEKEKMRGIWLKHARVCCSRKDMVDDRAFVSYRSPDKHFRVVVDR